VRIDQEHQVVEVLDHVVDRPDRAADLLGERPRPQGAEALPGDGSLGGGHQGLSQAGSTLFRRIVCI
jgi:hypothetical protein